jgi:aryl-alcohol dehydrogenase-like predicted oxidoreductase
MRAGNKLIIGTVQFGMAYGVANRNGQVQREEARAILSRIREAGVQTLDTAIVYGESEKVLGEVGVGDWRVISKLPPLPANESSIQKWVQSSVEGSLARLKMSRLHGLLFHNPDDLQGMHGLALYKAVQLLKEQGLVKKIGISIYSPDELPSLCEKFHFDIVQAPFNVLDRRIVTSGWAQKLKAMGTEIHVRSVFLQGLLLMNQRPAAFAKWATLWQDWDQWLEKTSVSALKASLNFALQEPAIDHVVIGVESESQLSEILASVDDRSPLPPPHLISQDLDLITPSRWSKA